MLHFTLGLLFIMAVVVQQTNVIQRRYAFAFVNSLAISALAWFQIAAATGELQDYTLFALGAALGSVAGIKLGRGRPC